MTLDLAYARSQFPASSTMSASRTGTGSYAYRSFTTTRQTEVDRLVEVLDAVI